MSYGEAAISGIVQGLTEFLPVSSSGHLVLLHHFFGHKETQLLFDIFLHLGTLFAVLVYFWRDIIKIIITDKRYLLYVFLGALVTALFGFALKDFVEDLFGNIRVVGMMLIVTAIYLFIGEWRLKINSNNNNHKPLGYREALIIGIVQSIALMPGASRSGITISTGLTLRLGKEGAIRFSFMLAIPVILGVVLYKIMNTSVAAVLVPHVIIGTAFSFLFGILAIRLLIKAVLTARLNYFAVYCLVLGTIVIVL